MSSNYFRNRAHDQTYTLPSASSRFLTVDSIKKMALDELRGYFEADAFPIGISWEEILRTRSEPRTPPVPLIMTGLVPSDSLRMKMMAIEIVKLRTELATTKKKLSTMEGDYTDARARILRWITTERSKLELNYTCKDCHKTKYNNGKIPNQDAVPDRPQILLTEGQRDAGTRFSLIEVD